MQNVKMFEFDRIRFGLIDLESAVLDIITVDDLPTFITEEDGKTVLGYYQPLSGVIARKTAYMQMEMPEFKQALNEFMREHFDFQDGMSNTIISRQKMITYQGYVRIGELYAAHQKRFAKMAFGSGIYVALHRSHYDLDMPPRALGISGTWISGEDSGTFSFETGLTPKKLKCNFLDPAKFERSLEQEFVLRWPHHSPGIRFELAKELLV